MPNDLPPNWSYVKLGDVCEPIDKVNDIKISESFYYLDIGGINNKNNLVETVKEYKWENAPSRAKQIVKNGDILFSTVRTYLKNIARVPLAYNNQIASTGFCVIRPKNKLLNSNFIFYLTLSNKFLDPLNALQVGSSYPAVRNGDVHKQPIPLPPLPEQKKIVEKIEELFSGLDSGVASLKKAKAQIRLYRQSVLASAFSGKLTQSAERQAHSELPTGWKWVKLGEVSKVKGGKRLPKGEAYSEIETKFPYIRVTDFENMSVRISELRYLKKETQTQIKNYIINKDDLYISIAGTIGRVGMIPSQLDGANLTENAAKITEIKNYDIRFLSYQMNSAIVQNQIKSLTISTTQPKLALFRIEKLDLVQPPIIVQTQIVEEIEKRFSEADNLERAIDESLAKSETLRQSILKKAFEGRLV